MYSYNITLRLNGALTSEVRKIVTAPEFLIMQYIHGKDSIHNVKEIKNENVNQPSERRRLISIYDKALKRKKQTVESIFGALGQLPKRLPDDVMERHNIDGTVEFEEVGRIKAGIADKYNKNEPRNEEELKNLENVSSSDEVNIADLLG